MREWAIRPARESDLPRVNDIYYTNEVDAAMPDPPARRPLESFAHEMETGRMLVAELDGEVIGFSAVLTRGNVTYLAELFIREARQSSGVGQALLRAILPHEGVLCTMASTDPRAVGLYTRFGMQPQWPHYWMWLAAEHADELPASDIVVVEAEADDPALVAWDAEIGGRPRPEDLAYWVARARAVPLWFRRGDETVGYGYLHAESLATVWYPEIPMVGPVGARRPEDAVDCVVAAVRWALARHARVRIAVPGPHPALRPLLAAHARIVYVETFCASAAVFDARRYVPSGDVL